MITAAIVVASVALAWILAFSGAPLLLWTVLAVAGYAALLVTGFVGAIGAVLLGVPTGLLLLFNIKPLRRTLLTRGIFSAFRRVLPEMSSTEREALDAGDTWWETELFRGRPDWRQLLDFQYTALTEAEQSFLDHEVREVCALMDDWKADFEDRDLPPEVWKVLKEKKFFAMLIEPEHGGLGFSSLAQSAVVTRLATRSISLAVTVMVPNSLGPGELLQKYGTEAQKADWLPRLAAGDEVPCFGLTGPEAGSDATAMPDTGVVCYGEHEGRKVLGIRLNFSKRWITLAPVATVIGLAFKLRDPDGLLGDRTKSEYGITCALLPATHPGIQIGRRHHPGAAFMNGPIFGNDVFIPVDWIIGGPKMAGHGWRMLVECLSAGRGISLPALATAAGQAAYRATGAYARIRRQFRMAVGDFEGVQEATGRIAGFTYTLEAMRVLSASAVDHCAPSVVTAIAKYHMTEMMRRVINDAMDVFGGRGVQQGPRNPLALGYKAVPIAITVEGANILTRNLMIFGQGAIRCHPFVFPEMEAARRDDLTAFDDLLFRHVGFSVSRGVRAFTLGLTGARLAGSPTDGVTADYFRQLARMSAGLAFVADVTMGVLGGELKRRERLSARLGDVLSQLYIGSAVLKYFISGGEKDGEIAHLRWAMDHCLAEIGRAFEDFFANFPRRGVARVMRLAVLPLGNPYRPVSDRLNGEVAKQLMQPTALRERLTSLVMLGDSGHDPLGRLERAYRLLLEVEPAYLKFAKMTSRGELAGDSVAERLRDAVNRSLLTREEADAIEIYDQARWDAIQTDDFSAAYLAGHYDEGRAEVVDIEARRVAAGR